ncbi:imidazolonepropionase [Endozoicomonas numazuensis]|uniref:Imidazolonepropionase n=1 Tax=Endozoicomonas numazuensis TaxID=1137799 RepID=A0A081NJH8_9GAMM|nr:imidazolonepropionase [Endozoicomonas numazuensis]KEQ18601.1 imidazolonepropionase [Endozoicomonas numazuensis]
MTKVTGTCDLLITHVHIATMDPSMGTGHYGELLEGAIAIDQGLIQWLGAAEALPANLQPKATLDGQGQWLMPGLIDCHTHLVYAGDRSTEFEQRLQGKSYSDIAQQGGGILSTVNATRRCSLDQLIEQSRPRLEALLCDGVTTLEIKSGYGLNLETELKILRAAKELELQYPVRIEKTFLGAHTLPPEFSGQADRYIEVVCEEMLPAIAEEGLATAVDVFCENIAFNLSHTEKVFQSARSLGLRVKLHAEQLSDSRGTQLATAYDALSVDHLEYLSNEGVKALENSTTVATLLPGAFYFLQETQRPPVEKLRASGIPMALATDLNPGTSPFTSLRLIMNMACTLFGLTPSEALAGVTIHAARALGLQDQEGMIKKGHTANLTLWPIQSPASLAASLTGETPSLTFYRGEARVN